MKKRIKIFVSMLVTMGICMSFAFTVQANAYDHIGFDYMQPAYGIGTTAQLSITAYDGNGDEVAFSGSVKYSSSDENVIKVDANGLMTMVNLGTSTITAKSGNLTASMLVTSYNTSINNAESTLAQNSHSTELVRTGSYSYKIQGGTHTVGNTSDDMDNTYAFAKINQLLAEWNTIPANAVMNVWFYDNGTSDDAEVAIYWSAYSIDARGTKAIGIINSSDTTYKLTGNNTRRARGSQYATGWGAGARVGICSEVTATLTDTGIARTKGWHQVTFVRKNTNASATVSDSGSSFPQSASADIYLDGHLVNSETASDATNSNKAFVNMYGYAGYDGNHSAYIADAKLCLYIYTENVTNPESSGTYTVNYDNFYGTAGDKTIRYNWQVSNDGKTGWTDIAGETNLTTSAFTPNVATYGDKFIRGGVRIIAGGKYPNYYYPYEPSYIFTGTYEHISLGKNTSYYTKGTSNNQLSLVGYARDMTERSIADLSGAVFTSSNESVVTVTNAGVLTAVDYGIATVTATYQGLSASMLVTVKNGNAINNNESTLAQNSHSTELVRTGSYSYKLAGGTLAAGTEDYSYDYANLNLLISEWNTVPANAVMGVWFYDNGTSDDAETAVYWSAYKNDTRGTKAVGIINSSDSTYKVTGNGARRALSAANRWREGSHVGICSDVTNTLIDTGITRTKGWHQVTFVRKNTDASAKMEDADYQGSIFPKSTSFYIYLDGVLVDRETSKDRSFVNLYGYAGYNSEHSAYIADIAIYQYVGVENVALSESNGTFTVNHNYYGTTGTQTNSYKWQISDDGVTGWTDIAGATGSTYTPTFNDRNKYIRGSVSVATSAATTGDRISNADVPNFSLVSAVADSTQINVGLKILNDTGASIPYALMIGYYNAAETEVVAFDSQVGSVTSGSSKLTHTFTIPEEARGNFSKAKIFLWENLNQSTPYTQDILVE